MSVSSRRQKSSHSRPIEPLESRTLLANVPAGFVDEVFVSGIPQPTSMAFAPDGRIFVTEKNGRIRVVKNRQLLGTPFAQVTTENTSERGLLGLAFDPDFETNGYVYVYYTATTPTLHNRVSRFTANGDVAVPGSEVVLLELPDVIAGNHNSGALHFGPDGKLYIAHGDNARSQLAQDPNSLFGKMLRINKDGTIPTDNPFYSQNTGLAKAVWATGLRNPFTFAFHPTQNLMFINDVGQATWEEINEGVAGANYGWPNTEGPTTNPAYKAPLYAYNHQVGVSISGGAFYAPSNPNFPAQYQNDYFFADYGSHWIRVLDLQTREATLFANGLSNPVDVDLGPDGYLYYLEHSGSRISRIRYTGTLAPSISQHPASQTVGEGSNVTFSVVANGSQPLSYQWLRNNQPIAGATGSSYTRTNVTSTDNGAVFSVRVSNSTGSITSNGATLTVQANTAPIATITSPSPSLLYAGGQVIQFSGAGADAQDGNLPASAMTWKVDFHHDTHFHPFMPETSGIASGSFTIPTTGETSANVWYRIYLTVRDSKGLTHTTFRDIQPRKVNLTINTNVPGAQATLDGQPFTGSITVPSVVGVQRTIGAVSPQTVGGTTYVFSTWSDGGAATHNVATPSSNTTYTVNYLPQQTGGGLLATYYDNIDFTGGVVQRVDSTVNFFLEHSSPHPSIGPDTYSVRWTGQVVPQFTQQYRFYTYADDGVRLWVNGQLLINDFTDHSATERSGVINLVAGQKYDIRLDYYENGGRSTVQLLWSSPSTPKQVIPASALIPTPTHSYTSTDVGSPIGGSTTVVAANAFDLRAGGRDVYDNSDQFRFAYRTITGDFDIMVRVESLVRTDEWAKAGLMARTSLAANAQNIFAIVSPTRYRFTHRSTAGGSTTPTGEGPATYPNSWVRLRRIGNTFQAFRSSDGINWTMYAQTSLALPSTLLVGMASTSHNTGALTMAKFRDLRQT